MAKRKNKQRGGLSNDETNNRADKAFNLHYLIEQINEYNSEDENMTDFIYNGIQNFKNEGEGKSVESLYFFTPEEVKYQNEQINELINKANENGETSDCENVEHAEFKDYVSDLIWMDDLFVENDWDSPKTQDRIYNLVRDLCPKSAELLLQNRENRIKELQKLEKEEGSLEKMEEGSLEKMEEGSLEKMEEGSLEEKSQENMEEDIPQMIQIPTEGTPDEKWTQVQKQFRALSKKHHPDMGGDKNTFLKLTQQRDNAKKYLSDKYPDKTFFGGKSKRITKKKLRNKYKRTAKKILRSNKRRGKTVRR